MCWCSTGDWLPVLAPLSDSDWVKYPPWPESGVSALLARTAAASVLTSVGSTAENMSLGWGRARLGPGTAMLPTLSAVDCAELGRAAVCGGGGRVTVTRTPLVTGRNCPAAGVAGPGDRGGLCRHLAHAAPHRTRTLG